MKFIKPSEISGKLMSLIEESDEKVILVSPYVKITKWYKLLKKVNSLKERNINFELYVREDKPDCNTYDCLEEVGLDYITIPNLHAKLYMNEKYAIVTSMNLLLSSEINSLEIGYMTETQEEYDELVDYINRYIIIHKNNQTNQKKDTKVNNSRSEMDWRDQFCENISEELNENVDAWPEDGKIRIKTRQNNYECFIHNAGRKNKFKD